MSVKKYRKKPVVIEAIEWTGDNKNEVMNFAGRYSYKVKNESLKIFTLEGTMKASVGDMIIKGIQGEFYPIKPDIFKATYEELLSDRTTSGSSSNSSGDNTGNLD